MLDLRDVSVAAHTHPLGRICFQLLPWLARKSLRRAGTQRGLSAFASSVLGLKVNVATLRCHHEILNLQKREK